MRRRGEGMGIGVGRSGAGWDSGGAQSGCGDKGWGVGRMGRDRG